MSRLDLMRTDRCFIRYRKGNPFQWEVTLRVTRPVSDVVVGGAPELARIDDELVRVAPLAMQRLVSALRQGLPGGISVDMQPPDAGPSQVVGSNNWVHVRRHARGWVAVALSLPPNDPVYVGFKQVDIPLLVRLSRAAFPDNEVTVEANAADASGPHFYQPKDPA